MKLWSNLNSKYVQNCWPTQNSCTPQQNTAPEPHLEIWQFEISYQIISYHILPHHLTSSGILHYTHHASHAFLSSCSQVTQQDFSNTMHASIWHQANPENSFGRQTWWLVGSLKTWVVEEKDAFMYEFFSSRYEYEQLWGNSLTGCVSEQSSERESAFQRGNRDIPI